MDSPFVILGIRTTSSVSEARTAYRKLASKHHPDKGGCTETFQRIKAAFELIEAGYKEPAFVPGIQPKTQPFTPYTSTYAKPKPNGPRIVSASPHHGADMYIARVSLIEAYNGFVCEIPHRGRKYSVQVPPGVPNGLQFAVPSNDGSTVIVFIYENEYKFTNLQSAVKEFRTSNGINSEICFTGDLYTSIEITHAQCSRGASVQHFDFLGARMEIIVPRYHPLGQPIRISNRGYVHWNRTQSIAVSPRADVLVSVRRTENVPMQFTHF